MMLCQRGKESDVGKYHLKGWIAQRKIDGVRCFAIVNSEGVCLKGRSGTDYTKKFQEIADELKGMNEGVYDGEIVCDTFEHTSSRVHTDNKLKLKLLKEKYPATFWVFDKISTKPLSERIEEIKEINGTFVKYLPFTFDLIGLWEKAKKENWEGIIIKKFDSLYSNNRSWNWLKIKFEKTRDIKFTNYEINPAGIRCSNAEGFAVQVAGQNSKEVKRLIDETGSAMVEVRYLNETESGMLRMPVFKDIKDGN